ncbi:MAG: SH3 domain-containing protein [Proteobacteria bacterium]|nr:SH3 domain-containing protein [Pseudomonadota bacterium]
MLRYRKRWFFALLATFLAGASLAALPRLLSVQVRQGQAHATPSFLGPLLATLAYGDQVEAREEQGAWTRVGLPGGGEGWMHTSALTEKKLTLTAGQANRDQSASGQELALAGKGFNAQVEGEFKARNGQLDFAWVDRMETFSVAPEQMARFLREGEVTPEGGAR